MGIIIIIILTIYKAHKLFFTGHKNSIWTFKKKNNNKKLIIENITE